MTSLISNSPIFNTTLQSLDNKPIVLPVSPLAPLFVVGPNGAGKSGLMLFLYRANQAVAVRIAAHRQNWMESSRVPFSPHEKTNTVNNVRANDGQSDARWKEWNPNVRSGIVIADLIDADYAVSRRVRDELKNGDADAAKKLAVSLSPLEEINSLFAGSGIPIELSIGKDSSISARKNGGEEYSAASLSDGERAALLLSGIVLTSKPHSLILIDEPERHLHRSIVTPLLLQLFRKRPDCTFVVSTHEIGLPVECPAARTVLVRDSRTVNEDVSRWDIDVLEPGIEIDDSVKEAIIGSRRKMLFIEGTPTSLDKPLYEILFPRVSIFPRATCRDVEYAVASIRDASDLTWVRAFGVVDQDQLVSEKKNQLASIGVFSLSVYSVEALYFYPRIVEEMAVRQCAIIEADPEEILSKAWDNFLVAVSLHIQRLAARMTEQAVKDLISLEMPDWKMIKRGQDIIIKVDAHSMYQTEQQNLTNWIKERDVASIIARYPVRETNALEGIVGALRFKSRDDYNSAVRKMLRENIKLRDMLTSLFGGLSAAIG